MKIGDTDLAGMSSEQVAQVLRQCGNTVKLVIARGPLEEPPTPAVPPSTPVQTFISDTQVMTNLSNDIGNIISSMGSLFGKFHLLFSHLVLSSKMYFFVLYSCTMFL